MPYVRHTKEAIRSGALPYLLGGNPEPCRSCVAGDHASFCRFQKPDQDECAPRLFSACGSPSTQELMAVCPRWRQFQHTAHLCSKDRAWRLRDLLVEKELWGPLLATPCDLWPHLRGRTLWILGDSQARLRVTAAQQAHTCHSACCWRHLSCYACLSLRVTTGS